jgi:hypothetical protein
MLKGIDGTFLGPFRATNEDVCSYGLFMDQQLLSDKGAQPADVRLAAVPGFVLRIGARAALALPAASRPLQH